MLLQYVSLNEISEGGNQIEKVQCVAVCCCSMLQCVAACCSVLQRVAVCCSMLFQYVSLNET